MEYALCSNSLSGEQWNQRKRCREEDEDIGTSGFGFSEHRTKRRIAALPHRGRDNAVPLFAFNTNHPQQQIIHPPTITPADSDEDTPVEPAGEPRSFFSPYSSSPTNTLTPSSPHLDALSSLQSTQMSDIDLYSDDCEMSDTIHLTPGPFHSDPASMISSRIPTPIHSSFAPYVRAEKAARHFNPDFADDEAMGHGFPRSKRLPSPISEGEGSPSILVEGLGDMQMEVEQDATPTKKGHRRSPHASTHSLRSWSGFGAGIGGHMNGGGNGAGLKRSFSMGYKADCDKCRNRVPNHFSHIIYE